MHWLKQSNFIFDKAFCNYLTSHGYTKLTSCDHTLVKYLNGFRIIVNMHVDDGLVISESIELYNDLKSILVAKYGSGMKFNDISDGYCGIGCIRHPTGAVSPSMFLNISRNLQMIIYFIQAG